MIALDYQQGDHIGMVMDRNSYWLLGAEQYFPIYKRSRAIKGYVPFILRGGYHYATFRIQGRGLLAYRSNIGDRSYRGYAR